MHPNNPKITDKGIKHMQLHTLYASYSSNITDEGIKHMQLHTLYASGNPNITDEGIKHMQLPYSRSIRQTRRKNIYYIHCMHHIGQK